MKKISTYATLILMASAFSMTATAAETNQSNEDNYLEISAGMAKWDSEILANSAADGKFEPTGAIKFWANVSPNFSVLARLEYDTYKHEAASNFDEQKTLTFSADLVRTFYFTHATELSAGFGVVATNMDLKGAQDYNYVGGGLDFYLEGNWYLNSSSAHNGFFMGSSNGLAAITGEHQINGQGFEAQQTMLRADVSVYVGYQDKSNDAFSWKTRLGVNIRENFLLGTNSSLTTPAQQNDLPVNTWGRSPGATKVFLAFGAYI